MRITLYVLAFILFAGCLNLRQPGADSVHFTTDQSSYDPGDDVAVRLENRTDQSIGYNLCTASLERESADGWHPAGELEVCTMIQHGLEPGASASYTKHLSADLPQGRYRYVTDVEYQATNRREPVATDVFSVGP